MSDKVPPAGRYYGGVLRERELIPAGDADSVPFEGEYLLIEVEESGILWSLHDVGEDACWARGGKAWVEPRGGAITLILGEPLSSGGSGLVPGSPIDPEVTRAYLAGLMTGLPKWPFEVRLADGFNDPMTSLTPR